MSLKDYQKRRNFHKTSEPKGKISKSENKLIFVVQKHAASHLHYDFRLELDGVLKSWAVPKGPCLDPKVKRLAVHVEDHPYEYASFEGIIPKGEYGGGSVIVWDQGAWIPEGLEPHAALRKGDLTFRLGGEKLKGSWKLIQTKNVPKNWLLLKLDDRYARSLEEYDITIKKPKSVLSSKTINQIAKDYQKVWTKKGSRNVKSSKTQVLSLLTDLTKTSIPEIIVPELATLVDKPPLGEQWLHEIKFDGYRLIIIKRKNKIRIFTRNQNDWTNKFTHLVKAINELPITNLILDGEVVVLDTNKKSNFQLLQNSLKKNEGIDFIFYAFDLIYYDQYDLSTLSLLDRKSILLNLLQTIPSKHLRFSDHVIGSGKEIFAKSCEFALEGIVSKNIYSPYLQKRTKDWLKVKCVKRQEFVIGGYTPPAGQRKYFGSLLLGTYNKKQGLVYNGNVGTGFTDVSLQSLYKLLKSNTSTTMPFLDKPPQSKNVTWVKPTLIAEVEFTEWTQDNHLRHPSFKGLRTDKSPQSIVKENEITLSKLKTRKPKIASKKLKKSDLTHADKILYPELKITKGEIAEYYEYIYQWMIPYVKNRPLTLVRCPGSYKNCFYQKHLGKDLPLGIYDIPIEEKNGEKEQYLYLKNKAGLLALTQLGVLEIHPWGSSIKKIETPDVLIFDLDPAEGIPWKQVVKTALLIKKYLQELNLVSFIKTTGGKGLHVVVPIKPKFEWGTIKTFSHSFVDFIVDHNPKEYVSTITKAARKGKIFIDYLRNQKGATAIAPYSTRASPNATIAVPLHWDELTNNIKDTTFNLKTIYKRMDNLKTDPWRDFFKIKQILSLK